MKHLYASIQCPARGEGQDRVGMLEFGPHVIVAVADGAGGMGGGGAAADLAISLATTLPDEVRGSIDSRYWTTRLLQIDAALASDPGGGQAALVVASVFEDVVVGAAAGDAVAWLIDAKDTRDLTAGTPRKPLLGDGAATPRAFGPVGIGSNTLLLATDGLWKYASRSLIAEHATAASLPDACTRLVDLVRLRSGLLQDDVGAALIRLSQ